MSKRGNFGVLQPVPMCVATDDPHWIEIFKDRIAEDLKQILQEDMDWMTSLPILERLDRLREIEAARSEREEARDEFRRAS